MKIVPVSLRPEASEWIPITRDNVELEQAADVPLTEEEMEERGANELVADYDVSGFEGTEAAADVLTSQDISEVSTQREGGGSDQLGFEASDLKKLKSQMIELLQQGAPLSYQVHFAIGGIRHLCIFDQVGKYVNMLAVDFVLKCNLVM